MSALSVEQCRRRLERGLIPAVPVPFTATGEIDWEAHKRVIAYIARQPTVGVAVWAHTGRGLHLTREQRRDVLRSWSDRLEANQVVVAGVGGPPREAIDWSAFVGSSLDMARDALDAGAHAFLVYPPSPFREFPHSEELILEYHKQLAAMGVPLILFYLYEEAGGISYSLEVLRQLLMLPEVLGIKLATAERVMTYQSIASLMALEFPLKLLITGEDRFLGYSLMCGAGAALIGMGAACTTLQHRLLQAYFEGRADEFLKLSGAVDRLSQVLFIHPMEGYIRRLLWALVHLGIINRESAHDPWGPALPESEFIDVGETLRALGQLSQRRAGQE